MLSKNLIFQNLSTNYKLDSKIKRFDDENLVLALFNILCSLHSHSIQHGGFIRARMRKKVEI
jgi:hypothetical protein